MLFRGSEESETRTLTAVGAALMLCCVLVAGFFWVDPFGGRVDDRMSVAIDTPYVVQGVVPGTALVMHGVEVGRVTNIASLPNGGVRLDADLLKKPVAGLTDTMQIDFRPANYFGVTGINIVAGIGGQVLRDGMHIATAPTGNFTLQALLSRLGELSTGVITPQLIEVIDRTTKYTDAMEPLIETMVIAGSSLAQVQQVPTARLLANATGLSVVFPSLMTAVSNAGDAITHADMNWMRKGVGDLTEEEWNTFAKPTILAVQNGIFGALGKLEGSHVGDLLPLVNGIQTITDAVPPLLRPEATAQMLVDLRTRFEKLYGGTPEQSALRVRIVLDSLPGVAAPLGAMGVPQ